MQNFVNVLIGVFTCSCWLLEIKLKNIVVIFYFGLYLVKNIIEFGKMCNKLTALCTCYQLSKHYNNYRYNLSNIYPDL